MKLSTQQSVVCQLVADGLSNKQIAEKMGISDGTVKVYIRNIRLKLHMLDGNGNDRVQLAGFVWRGGLVDVWVYDGPEGAD